MEVITQHIGCHLVASMLTPLVLTSMFAMCAQAMSTPAACTILTAARLSIGYAFRPCITLNSNVQVTSGDGTESSPFEIK